MERRQRARPAGAGPRRCIIQSEAIRSRDEPARPGVVLDSPAQLDLEAHDLNVGLSDCRPKLDGREGVRSRREHDFRRLVLLAD
jgi:hypothetical protein